MAETSNVNDARTNTMLWAYHKMTDFRWEVSTQNVADEGEIAEWVSIGAATNVTDAGQEYGLAVTLPEYDAEVAEYIEAQLQRSMEEYDAASE